MDNAPAPNVRRVVIGCEDRRGCFTANDHMIVISREDDDAYYGRPVENPQCPELQYPKYAWIILRELSA